MLKVNRNGKSRLQWDKVQDSGTRTAFGTGSQRDTQEGKGRYDLIPTAVLHRLAVHYENGATKYGDNNWQKGQSLAQYYNSAMRHLNAIKDADLSEDHFAAAIWNVAAMIHHIDAMIDGTLSRELDSFGIVEKVEAADTDISVKVPQYYNPNTFIHDKPNAGFVKTVASGVMPDDPFAPLIDYGAEAYDRDRFKQEQGIRRFRTIKLDPEELG